MFPVQRETTSAKKSAFARALERFRKSRAVEPSNATSFPDWPGGFPKPAPEPDEFYFVMRCAVTGRYSRALYKRAPNGMFIPQSKLTKVERGRADAGGMAAGPPPWIDARRIRLIDEPCPWCAGKVVHNHIHCGRCRKILCTGRSYLHNGKVIFVCHEDCGEHGPVGDPITSYAVEPKTPPASGGPHLPRQTPTGVRRTVVAIETTVVVVRKKR